MNISYFEPDKESIDPYEQLLFELSAGDLSKVELIENLDRDRCYQWLFIKKTKEVNEMKIRIEEIKSLGNNRAK